MNNGNSIEVIEIDVDSDVLLINIPIGNFPMNIAEKYVDKIQSKLSHTNNGKFNKVEKVFTIDRTNNPIQFKIIRLK